MDDSRRVGMRPVLVAAVLAGGVLVGSGVGLAGMVALSRFGSGMSGPPLPAELVESVGAAMVVGGFLAMLPAAVIAIIAARMFTRPAEALGRLVSSGASGTATDSGAAAATMPAPATPLREFRSLAQAIREANTETSARFAVLERESGELSRLLEAVGEGILQLDTAGRIVRSNPAAERMLALPPDATGAHFEMSVRQNQLRRVLAGAVAGGDPGPRELALDDLHALVMVEPLDADGGGSLVRLVDFTEMERVESIRRDFVANASHELKTPLTSIRGYAETLAQSDPPPEVRREFIQTIRRNADRLQRIVDDLLDLSRLESGRWEPDLQAVPVEVVARESWEPFRADARERGVGFSVDSGDLTVRADPGALRQILTNLFDNALRHTPSGGQIALTAASVEHPSRIDVEVRDTGSGIPGDAVPRIFERFYRVDPARSRSEGGTGLGLAIVKHLTEMMGGDVEAESRLGHGTAIRILLPRAADPSTHFDTGDSTG